jgi:hypothetical protein
VVKKENGDGKETTSERKQIEGTFNIRQQKGDQLLNGRINERGPSYKTTEREPLWNRIINESTFTIMRRKGEPPRKESRNKRTFNTSRRKVEPFQKRNSSERTLNILTPLTQEKNSE